MQITPSDEFFDLNGGHIWILQHFHYKNQKKKLLNLSDQHFLASGLGCMRMINQLQLTEINPAVARLLNS